MTITAFIYIYGFVVDGKTISSLEKKYKVEFLEEYLKKKYNGIITMNIPHDVEHEFGYKEESEKEIKEESDEDERAITGKIVIGKIITEICFGVVGKLEIKQLTSKDEDEL